MNLEQELEKYVKVTKRILKAKLSKNPQKLVEYREDIIKAHNDIVSHINEHYDSANRTIQYVYDTKLDDICSKTTKCFEYLKCQYELPSSRELIEDKHVGPPLITEIEEHKSGNEEDSELGSQSERAGTSGIINPKKVGKKTMEASDFLRLCASQINKNYAGDPLGLDSFIDSIELLETMATTTELKKILFSFIKTKLEGRAREYIVGTVTTIDHIKTQLKTTIKPDNSKVVEGRILNLKYNSQTSEEFAEKANNLADALRRTLIIEGMTPTKASEITIEKTIELCRRNIHNDMIKAVLESTKFESPKDVIAKMFVQIDKTRTEHQVLIYKNQGKRGNNSNYRGREYYNNNRRTYNKNANFQNVNNNNYRGRSNHRGRGRGNNNNNNRRTYYNNQNQIPGSNANNSNGSFVRVITNSGNMQAAPLQTVMGPNPIQNDNH